MPDDVYGRLQRVLGYLLGPTPSFLFLLVFALGAEELQYTVRPSSFRGKRRNLGYATGFQLPGHHSGELIGDRCRVVSLHEPIGSATRQSAQ